MEVKCYLKARRTKNMKKHFVVIKNSAGFVSFYFALCLILAYSNIVRRYEMLLT